MDLTTYVATCVQAADAEMVGELPDAVLGIPGMTSTHVRSFLHHLTRHQDLRRYAEVGCHLGATACAAGVGSPEIRVSCCDNYSQFQMADCAMMGASNRENIALNAETMCRDNLLRHVPDRHTLFTGDSMEWEPGPQDVLFYDGDHSEDATRVNIGRHVDLTGCRVLIVDDFNGDTVAAGAVMALHDLAYAVPRSRMAGVWRRPWWNGVLVVVFGG